MRIYPEQEPFVDLSAAWSERGTWPAKWVDRPGRSVCAPSVVAFRLRFHLAEDSRATIHVSADNRYRLFLDGEALGRGPERGDARSWPYESYALDIGAGVHVLVALNWWLGDAAPYAQMQIRPGFLLQAEGALHEILSTGCGAWEAKEIAGFTMLSPEAGAFGTGAKVRIDGTRFPWGWETGADIDWLAVEAVAPAMLAAWKNEIPPYWLLTPATLPPMKETRLQRGRVRHVAAASEKYPVNPASSLFSEEQAWQRLLSGQEALTITAHARWRAIVDLEDYVCAYPELRVSGGRGAVIRIRWAEALFEHPEGGSKGNRDEIDGKYFLGVGDEFLPDGGRERVFSTLWWQAGRYLEITVETADEGLTLSSFCLLETGYPFSFEQRFRSSDPRLGRVIPIALRALCMCSHETYMDCPYYEQLMYVGDARLEALATYTATRDDRLPRKTLRCFDASRLLSGFTQSRYPSRVTQVIPTFSLWYVCMVHDYWSYRDDMDFVRTLMPGVRAVVEGFRPCMRDDGLLGAPRGLNFVDWVPGWVWGVPPDGAFGASSIVNLQLVLALLRKAELEEFFGERQLAERDRDTAHSVMDNVLLYFWDETRQMLADNLAHSAFSEHAQCLAVLSGLLDEERVASIAHGMDHYKDLSRTTIYFSHYLFHTLYLLGKGDRMLERMEHWFEHPRLGLKTTLEAPEPSRSDCHAWGAHPLYHYHASLLGVRPEGPGFRRVRIAPLLEPLERAEGILPHPRGVVWTSLEKKNGELHVRVMLPEATGGTFVWKGQTRELEAGENAFVLEGCLQR